MAAKLPYKYGEDQEEQLPDGISTQPIQTIQPLDNVQPQQQQPKTKPQLKSESGQVSAQPQQPVPVKTFAQLQAEGYARPPMPTTANMSVTPSDRTQVGSPNGSQAPAPRIQNPMDQYSPEEWGRMSVAERNAATQGYNRQTAGDDAANNIASIKGAGGVYGAGEEDAAHLEFMRQGGFDAEGNFIGEPANNPDATPGFPSNYDPNAPVQPNNGWVGPDGQYHTEQLPPEYIVNGQRTNTPPTNTPPDSTGATAGNRPNGSTALGSSANQQGTFDLLQELINGASGNGPGSDVQNATRDALLKFLENPNPYGADDVKNEYARLGGEIDDEYSLNEGRLGEEMARRGLGFSTNYGGRLQDLNIGKRDAKTRMGQDLLHQYATRYGEDTRGAIGLGNQIGTQNQNNAQSWLAQLMGYGQQAFDNDFKTNALNQSTADSYRNWILQMLGMGYGGAS